MSAPALEKPPVEAVDLAGLPSTSEDVTCQNLGTDCDRPAAVRVRLSCGCGFSLCKEHAAMHRRTSDLVARLRLAATCNRCGAPIDVAKTVWTTL